MNRLSQFIRCTVFFVNFVVSTLFWALLSLLILPLPFRIRHRIINRWNDLNLWMLRRVCALNYQVEGLENLPPGPAVIMANHQSTWETMAFNQIFPPLTWVVKRELLWVPFFGWGLAALEPIAIDRKSGQRARDKLIQQARQRLGEGRWILVFPEGTRVLPGETRPFKQGGVRVASLCGVPVVPVAHNAGDFWPRRHFYKRPGTITVSIGPPIDPNHESLQRVTDKVRAWIDTKRAEL